MARIPRQLARGTSVQVAAYTGPVAEPIFNTETKRLHMQDGATAGGVPLARLDDVQSDSILRYGASANDGTTDARTAISAAIAAGVKNLYFPPGTYVFPDKLPNLNSVAGLTFRGAGRGATIFKSTVTAGATPTGDTVFLFLNGCTNTRVEDITFDMNSILTTNANTSAIGQLGGSGLVVRRCEIKNGRRVGIFINGAADCIISENIFSKAGGAVGSYQNEAVIFSNSAGDPARGRFEGNTCLGWGTLFSGSDLVIVGNRISGHGYGGGITLNVDPSTSRPIICHNVIADSSGVDVNGAHPAGIECWSYASVIHGNICQNNSGAGIIFAGAYSSVKGNICVSNGNYSYGPGDYRGVGIGLTWQSGIQPAQNCVVEGNICYDSGPGYQKWGYQELETASATFSNNLIRGNQMAGNIAGDYDFSGFSGSIQFSGYEFEGSVSVAGTTYSSGLGNASVTISVPGAKYGDMVEVAVDAGTNGLIPFGYVAAANTVFAGMINLTGSDKSLATTTWRAKVKQRRPS